MINLRGEKAGEQVPADKTTKSRLSAPNCGKIVEGEWKFNLAAPY